MGVCVDETAEVERVSATAVGTPDIAVVAPGAAAPVEKRWWPGLDGMRGVAVLLVVAYHLWPSALPGGWVGVSMFFTLSGFLITTVLLDERARVGRISFVGFWGRRARRLVPALLVTVVVVSGMTALFNPDGLHAALVDGAAGLAYIANWTAAAAPGGYAAIFGSPGPFDHLWSLAVEEQIYLVLPVMFVISSRSRRASAATWMVVVTVIAAGIFHWWGSPDSYYVTPVRASEVAAGAAAAMLMWRHPTGLMHGGRLRGRSPAISVLCGVVGVATLAWVAFSWTERDPLLFRGGPVLLAASSVAVVVLAISHPGPLAHPVPRWFGTRSYAIYLWHWPLLATFDWNPILILAATGVISEISMRLIETPIRRRQGYGANFTRPILAFGVIAGVTAVAGVGIAARISAPQSAISIAQPVLPRWFSSEGAHNQSGDADTSAGGGSIPVVFVLGDSTAYAALDGLRAWSNDTRSAVIVNGTTQGCSPVQDDLTPVRLIRHQIERRGWSPDRSEPACRLGIPEVSALANANIPDEVLLIDWGMIVSPHVDPAHPFDKSADLRMSDPSMAVWLVKAYQARIDEAATYGASVLLATAPHLGAGRSGFFASLGSGSNDDVDAYNAVIAALTEANPNVELVHTGEAIDRDPMRYRRADGVHLDAGESNLRLARDLLADPIRLAAGAQR